EAIAARIAAGNTTPGHITIELTVQGARLAISVRDNGIGLPTENRHRLTEPYVTTRAKGTGLGLAIVRKILEDHGGELLREDGDKNTNADGEGGGVKGAILPLIFPLRRPGKMEQGFSHEAERVA